MAAKKKGCVSKSRFPARGMMRTSLDFDKKLFKRFKGYCHSRGMNVCDSIRTFMQSTVNQLQ